MDYYAVFVCRARILMDAGFFIWISSAIRYLRHIAQADNMLYY